MFRPLWIEIDLKALRHNFLLIKKKLNPQTKIMAVVKQSAYGHGLVPVAKELEGLGADFFGVGSLEEAIALRKARVKKPILVLSIVSHKFRDYFLEYDLSPTVVTLAFASCLNKAASKRKKPFAVHVKIDTGMGRLGPFKEEAYLLIKKLSRMKYLFLEGIFTHLPKAEDKCFSLQQIKNFEGFIEKLSGENIHFKYQHCANSLGLLSYPEAHFNMVRPGLILYGVKPASFVEEDLRPILSLKSKIIFIKKIKKGMGVSYAHTYIAKEDTYIATVAVGYADGYPWALSNSGKVIIKDSLFRIAGRVCMDHIMVELGKRKDIKVGEEVILIGKKGSLTISAEDLALWARTIPYEIISRLSPKIPRIYKNGSYYRYAPFRLISSFRKNRNPRYLAL